MRQGNIIGKRIRLVRELRRLDIATVSLENFATRGND